MSTNDLRIRAALATLVFSLGTACTNSDVAAPKTAVIEELAANYPVGMSADVLLPPPSDWREATRFSASDVVDLFDQFEPLAGLREEPLLVAASFTTLAGNTKPVIAVVAKGTSHPPVDEDGYLIMAPHARSTVKVKPDPLLLAEGVTYFAIFDAATGTRLRAGALPNEQMPKPSLR